MYSIGEQKKEGIGSEASQAQEPSLATRHHAMDVNHTRTLVDSDQNLVQCDGLMERPQLHAADLIISIILVFCRRVVLFPNHARQNLTAA